MRRCHLCRMEADGFVMDIGRAREHTSRALRSRCASTYARRKEAGVMQPCFCGLNFFSPGMVRMRDWTGRVHRPDACDPERWTSHGASAPADRPEALLEAAAARGEPKMPTDRLDASQCDRYAGDPGASAPRCESYRGHPGPCFIRKQATYWAGHAAGVAEERARIAAQFDDETTEEWQQMPPHLRVLCRRLAAALRARGE